MWVMDGVNVSLASGVTQKVWLITVQVLIDGLLLLGWLVWSFLSLWKLSSKSTKRAKIINIVEENPQKSEPRKTPSQVTHLFDDLNEE